VTRQPYYQDESTTLYHGDCREILPQLGGEFFCFSDPPYNRGKDYGGWNDAMPDDEYLSFCVEWIKEVTRLCVEVCLLTPNNWHLEYWNMLGKRYQQIILPFTHEGVLRNGFVNQHHVLLTNAKPKERVKNVWYKVQMHGMGYFFKEDNFDHPGYTSEDLTGRVLRYLASPNVPVLDPFGGSGTTARVAKNMGRKCVTIEYSERWCEFIAKERLAQMVMFSQ
jgi:site-specific DNA-methyltransferase (adenine-specific)